AGSQLESLANRLTDGALTPLITHFVEERKISRDDIQQLRQLLNNLDSAQE
ncbi:MAG: BlaI/MecI/CopY family transcriptional regulator, partial [Verrucomicrobia bacterium]|nr:BlaI/MecI/CopY family transcriptional regulator [Verrucomicrobiota bacterium]